MKLTVGLEIHAELKTLSKMFCDSLNDPNEHHPNINICPVCAGHPGTLPTINKKAVEYVLRVGLALGGTLAKNTKFDRKNYFYPDLPKGYQISQYDEPLVSGGELLGVRIRRIHLEEDAGSLTHSHNHSLVDFNRAGMPLMELVTEPDITSAKQAADFARELQLIFRYLGVSEADMEKGLMRIEANISVDMGVKVEVKNLNSFRAVEKAIAYEFERQTKALEEGKKIVQETRGWDDIKGVTVIQRTKEGSHDYRYFPEPDLPPFNLAAFNSDVLTTEQPELPAQKRVRFQKEFSLTADQVELLIQNRAAANFFEEAVSELFSVIPSPSIVILSEAKDLRVNSAKNLKKDVSVVSQHDNSVQLLYNYFTTDLFGLMMKQETDFSALKITPASLANLVSLIANKEISSRTAKDLLLKMFQTGGDPRELMKVGDLGQVSDDAPLRAAAEKVLLENSVAVGDYKKGKTNVLQFLVGQTMKELRGRGNAETLCTIFEELLK